MWKVGREKQKFEKGRKDVLKAEEVEGRRGKNKDEWKEGKVKIKDLESGEEIEVSVDSL